MLRNKKVMSAIFAALVAIFISAAAIMPAMSTVFASEQTPDQQQPATEEAPKDNPNEHSGHHM